MTINDVVDSVDRLIEKNNFSRNPDRRFVFLGEELGEVARALTKLEFIRKTIRHPFNPKIGEVKAAEDQLGDEIADLIWNAVAIGRISGIDVDAAITRKLSDSDNRDFPKRT